MFFMSMIPKTTTDIRNIRPNGKAPDKIYRIIDGEAVEIKKAYRIINDEAVVVWDVGSEKIVHNLFTVWNITSDNLNFTFPKLEETGHSGYIQWIFNGKDFEYNSQNAYLYDFETTSSTHQINIMCDVTKIVDDAFRNRKDLKQITLPATVEDIGERAFSNCTALTKVSVNGGGNTFGKLTELKRAMFYGCTALTGIFANDTQKTDIFKNITAVRYQAFQNCSALQGTYNFENLEKIEDYAFYSARYFFPKFGDKLNYIGKYAFYYSGVTNSITIPKGVKTISESAFMSCKSLYGITFENDGVETIDRDAFYGCTNLSSVKFGNRLKTIGTTAFSNCTSIKNIVFEHVEQIGLLAFNACYGLTSVEIPSSVTAIDDMAFMSCTKLKTIRIHKPQDSIPNAPWSAGAWSGGVSDCNVIWLG